MNGWIGVDFDGTLAEYDGWKGAGHVGAPIPKMVERVKALLAEGKDVRIFTARVYCPNPADLDVTTVEYHKRKSESKLARRVISAFCYTQFGRVLPITCVKDPGMIQLFDDRCTQVVSNTGDLIVKPEPQETERQLASNSPRAFNSHDAVDKLSIRYGAIIEVLHAVGCTEKMYAVIQPKLQAICEEGRKYGVSFDPHPTLRWRLHE